MPRILLVKTSSLGDVVHNLPVASDVLAAFPESEIDWVVEETFAAIPCLHAGISSLIPVAMRRWRKSLQSRATRLEIQHFIQQLRRRSYDAVIDTQGLFKSAIIARAARGVCHGLDWASSREPLRCFYDYTYSVPWGQHAVQRNRSLTAQALGYELSDTICYGIAATSREFNWLFPGPYAVLLHASSSERKFWPEPQWTELARLLAVDGTRSVLPWGNEAEQVRAERLAQSIPDAIVTPALGLEDAAALLGQARAVVGIDTGLTHLSAALGTRTVGIYCDTDPAATGTYGSPYAVNLGGIGALPQASDVWSALNQLFA